MPFDSATYTRKPEPLPDPDLVRVLTHAPHSWDELNDALRAIENDAACRKLLKRELAHVPPRPLHLLRIHARMNKLRASRERAELMAKCPPGDLPLKNEIRMRRAE